MIFSTITALRRSFAMFFSRRLSFRAKASVVSRLPLFFLIRLRGRFGGKPVSSRPFAVGVALSVLLLPQALHAQYRGGGGPCVPGQEANCAPGELPFEEFINGPPENLGTSSVPPVSERPLDPNSGERIPVRHFAVEGITPNPESNITPEKVQAAADVAFKQLSGGAEAVELTVGQMVKVSDAVTTYYRNNGYIVAKAFLPVQDIGPDGVVKVQVMEGKVAEVQVEGAKHYSPKVLARPAQGLVGRAPTREAVETAVLYAQDYPGARLFGTFKPGAQTGETKFVMQVLDEDRLSFSGSADNFGTKFTGQYRLQVGADWNNPIGFGDVLDVSVLQAVSPANDTFGSISYRIPMITNGLTASGSASRNAFSVTGSGFDVLQLEGTIFDYSLGSNWRFIRTRFFNSAAGLTFDRKVSKLTALGTLPITNDNYNMVTLDASADRIDTVFKGIDQGSFSFRHGLGGEVGTGGKGDANFNVFQLRYARLQALAETQTALLRLRYQYTPKALVALEQFAPSGPDGVRAYPVGDFLRDKGLFASLEYRVQAPGFASAAGPFGRTWGDLLQVWLFGDYAQGSNVGVTNTNVNLSGYGMSLQLGIPSKYQFLIQAAKPISSQIASDGKNGVRVFGSISVRL
jgi:hemolysin activation/secretion protein